MQPANTPHALVSVEYDCKSSRSVRIFEDPYTARSFYVSKAKIGQNPKVLRSDTMAKTTPTKKTPVKKSVKKSTTEKTTHKKKSVKKETTQTPKSIWTKERIVIIRAMKQLKATSSSSARLAADIATKAGLDELDVKYYCYKTEKLYTQGYTSTAKLEDTGRCISYYLKPKGDALDLRNLNK